MAGNRLCNFPVVPNDAIRRGIEPSHGLAAKPPDVTYLGIEVVELVGGRHQGHVAARTLKVVDVALLAFLPGRLLAAVRAGAVATCGHDVSDPRIEPLPNLRQGLQPALILNGVMEQRCYRNVLIAAPFQHGGADGHQVSNVGHIIALPGLCPVETLGIGQRFSKSIRKHFVGAREIDRGFPG